MSKFGDAFQRGQEAYQSAERAKAEIQDVFRTLSADIEQQTHGLVSTSVMRFTHPGKIFGPAVMGPGLTTMMPLANTYDALVAVAKDERPVELCTVKGGPYGYPVTLTFPGHSVAAHDRESLEEALVGVLAHPEVAGKLKLAMESARVGGASLPTAVPAPSREQ